MSGRTYSEGTSENCYQPISGFLDLLNAFLFSGRQEMLLRLAFLQLIGEQGDSFLFSEPVRNFIAPCQRVAHEPCINENELIAQEATIAEWSGTPSKKN